uniref:Uncharacterized protein n=1 Tax=Salmonella sp. TaxID=599 RepID=A0A482EXH1_SALSP|nr:hypothetical protein NNIBIDOC_00239 [Salmonella sp.]
MFFFLSSRRRLFIGISLLGEDKSLSFLETWTLPLTDCFQAMNKSKLRVIRHEETVITNINPFPRIASATSGAPPPITMTCVYPLKPPITSRTRVRRRSMLAAMAFSHHQSLMVIDIVVQIIFIVAVNNELINIVI